MIKLFASLLLTSSLAHAEAPANVDKCLARPLELGAAITARLPEAGGGLFGFGVYNHVLRLVQAGKQGTLTQELTRRLPFAPAQAPAAVGGRRIEGSPSNSFLAHYRSFSNPLYTIEQFANRKNLASFVASSPEPGSTEYEARKVMGYNLDADGAWQVEALLDGRNRKYFDDASVIFGVDLFYWDTSNGDCDRTHLPEISAQRLIEASAKAGKVLFIGTVPLEDGSKVPINSLVTGIEGVWYPNKHVCAANVNATIHANCLTKNGCYIVDLAGMAATLNADQTLFVKAQDRAFNRRQMRPDGVHISSVGTQYVMEQMVSDFETNPPACR